MDKADVTRWQEKRGEDSSGNAVKVNDFEVIPNDVYARLVSDVLYDNFYETLTAVYGKLYDESFAGHLNHQELNRNNVFAAGAEELCVRAIDILEEIGILVRPESRCAR